MLYFLHAYLCYIYIPFDNLRFIPYFYANRYTLDGYPTSKRQLSLLVDKGIVPFRAIELKVDSHETLIRGTQDRQNPGRRVPLHDSAQILAIRGQTYQLEVASVRKWLQANTRNFTTLDATVSMWALWTKFLEEVQRAALNVQDYVEAVTFKRAAPLADLCITPDEFEARLGTRANYFNYFNYLIVNI